MKQDILSKKYDTVSEHLFIKPETIHLTILMLTLDTQAKLEAAKTAFMGCQKKIAEEILKSQPFKLTVRNMASLPPGKLPSEAKVIYLELGDEGQQKVLREVSNVLITAMMASGVISEAELSHVKKSEEK